MRVGMNTNAIFTPQMRMLSKLKETAECGLSRIEISYYADSEVAQTQLFKSEFDDKVHSDLDLVQESLISVHLVMLLKM